MPPPPPQYSITDILRMSSMHHLGSLTQKWAVVGTGRKPPWIVKQLGGTLASDIKAACRRSKGYEVADLDPLEWEKSILNIYFH